MFRATSCSSSGESVFSIQHLLCVTLCRWRSIVHVWKFLPDLHTRRSSTEWLIPDLYWYNWFSWWWIRGCSKHVQKWNKRIRIVRQVGCLQDLYQDAGPEKYRILLGDIRHFMECIIFIIIIFIFNYIYNNSILICMYLQRKQFIAL
jgi:hypothetical protein